MKIKTLYIVTKPTPASTLEDILFEANAEGLALQFKGGLDPASIHGMYTHKKEAAEIAAWLLNLVNDPLPPV